MKFTTAGEYMTQFDREQLTEMLRNNVCEVTFTKVDGSVRVMPCTLREDVVPPYQRNDDSSAKKKNDAVISAWCTDKREWRSFRVANVTNVEIKND